MKKRLLFSSNELISCSLHREALNVVAKKDSERFLVGADVKTLMNVRNVKIFAIQQHFVSIQW